MALPLPPSVLGSPGRPDWGGACTRALVAARARVCLRLKPDTSRWLRSGSRELASGPGVGGVALGCVLGGGDSSRCFLAGAPEAPPPQRARAAAAAAAAAPGEISSLDKHWATVAPACVRRGGAAGPWHER